MRRSGFRELVRSGDGSPSPLRTAVSITADCRRLVARFRSEFRVLTPWGRGHDDDLWRGDVVELFLAPDTDDRTLYYEIEVNPEGFLFDARVDSPDLDRRTMRVDRGWNPKGIGVRSRIVRAAGTGIWLVRIALDWDEIGLGGAEDHPIALGAFRIDRTSTGSPIFLALEPNGADPPDFHIPRSFTIFPWPSSSATRSGTRRSAKPDP